MVHIRPLFIVNMFLKEFCRPGRAHPVHHGMSLPGEYALPYEDRAALTELTGPRTVSFVSG